MKKVGKLNGKVVVLGDKNLVTANQIHYEEKDDNITLSERRGGELSSITGSVDNTDQINMFDLVKNPRFVCIVNDTSGSELGPVDAILGDMGLLIPCIVHNKKKGMGTSVFFDITSNGFKGFPCYAMFDYDSPTPFGGGTLGSIIDEAIQNYPEDGYYITKDEFLKAWNEASLL